MAADTTSWRLVDNTQAQRYELNLDGSIAHVDYERTPGTIRFIHTIVPAALRGHGIGGWLAQHVLDDSRSHGEKVIPQCPFIAAYIADHPEYQDLVAA